MAGTYAHLEEYDEVPLVAASEIELVPLGSDGADLAGEQSDSLDREEQSEPDFVDAPAPRCGPFPTSVYLIVGNEFCERFCFYGMKSALSLYLTSYLLMNEDSATAVVHTFNFFAYLFPLAGGIMSDTYFGKFNTILYLSMVYFVGMLLLSVTAIPGVTGDPPGAWGVALSLFLIAVGTGGIKPCVSAFGGDQFSSRQTSQLELYFSAFYFSINMGSFLATMLTPFLRGDVSCFGSDQCYPLAFGVPALLMLAAIALFFGGRSLYRRLPASGENIIVQVWRIIASSYRRRREPLPAGGHWLDRAVPEHGARAVSDVRRLLRVLTVLTPVPLFWTLFDQQSSRWTYQAVAMDRYVYTGTDESGEPTFFIIKPDVIQVMNAVLILVLIPVMSKGVYPLLRRLGFALRPLQRMGAGLALAALTFLVAAIIQLSIDKSVMGPDPNDPVCAGDDSCCVENCVSVFWQIPQYVIITAGEVLFSVTGLEFAYSQAPQSMKGVCSAAWLFTVAIGNLLVILVSALKLFGDQATEFFVYAGLMVLVVGIFALLASKYVYVSTGK